MFIDEAGKAASNSLSWPIYRLQAMIRFEFERSALRRTDAVQPLVDQRHRNRCVVERVDSYMELMSVRSVISGVGVPMQQWKTVIVWAMSAVTLNSLRVTFVRIVRREKRVPASCPLENLRKNRPPSVLIHGREPFDALARLRRRRNPIMIAGYEIPLPVQLSGPCNRPLDRPECEITEMQDDRIHGDCLVPAADQFSIHLVGGIKRPLRKFANARMPEVSVSRHEVHDVKVELWVAIGFERTQLGDQSTSELQRHGPNGLDIRGSHVVRQLIHIRAKSEHSYPSR